MPEREELGTYHRPAGHLLLGSRDLQGVVLHLADERSNGIGYRAKQKAGWHHQQQYTEEHYQGCCQAGSVAHHGRQSLVGRVEGNGQHQGPEHQGHEGGQNLVTEENQ